VDSIIVSVADWKCTLTHAIRLQLVWRLQQQVQKPKKPAITYSKTTDKGQEKVERRQCTTCTDPKTVKELLGELYTDKEYLEKLLRETGL